MRIDLHNHTTRCNHASGSTLEFASKACELGIDIYGFACHAPMKFDEEYRMRLSEIDEYINEVTSLCENIQAQESVQNPKMQILVGLEVDFILGREDLLEPSVLGAPLDYLIGSVHFLDDWGFDNPAFLAEYAKKDLESCWVKYFQSVAKMAQSRLFQIVGHIDLLKVFGYAMPHSSACAYALECALKSIKEANMSIELNAAGLRKQIGEIYPSKEILQKAYALGIPITFGSDAHALAQVGFGYDKCVELAREVGYDKCVYYKQKQAIEVDFSAST